LGLGLAAAAALLAFGLSQGAAPPAELGFLAQHDRAAHASAPLISAAAGSEALTRAFRDAGVPPALAHAPDLSSWGFALIGGVVSDGPPGVALVYEKDGQRYVCQIYANLRTHSRPDQTVEVQGVRVRGFQDGARGVVEWSAGGRTCLFSGPGDVSALMAVVSDRIRRSRGSARG
jgi:anti-sigma factor RsiW